MASKSSKRPVPRRAPGVTRKSPKQPTISAPAGQPRRDIVAIGASAGGIDALSAVVAGLPPDLGATVFVVVHMQAGPSMLPDILSSRGPIKATHALHGEKIERRHIYVAPPDNHVLVRQGYIDVVRGPRENGHRPSIDLLFRTASNVYGPRVIGIVLTGYQDCGTGGLISIKARGGVTVVQDPEEAEAPDMPRSAIEHVDIDHVVRLRDLPALIARLTREVPGPAPQHLPGNIAELEGAELGVGSDIVCPACHGRITETEVNGFRQFRCHVGHVFSLQGVTIAQADEIERSMWAAARSLEESASLAARVAAGTNGDLRTRMLEKERQQLQHAQMVRRLILEGRDLTQQDADAQRTRQGAGKVSPQRTPRRMT